MNAPTQSLPWIERYPALERLRRLRRRTIPVVRQMELADCGAACLTMVLRYFGYEAPLSEVRSHANGGRDGADALTLLRAAGTFGLQGRGLKIEPDALHHLKAGAILHWEFNHFVVFEKIDRRWVTIIDPSFGRRKITHKRLEESFTGVALVFERTEAFQARSNPAGKLSHYFARLLVDRGLVTRVLVTSIALRLLALALPLLTALIVDIVVPRNDTDLLLLVGAGLGAVALFQLLSALIRSHLLLQLRSNLDVKLTLGFLDHLVELPYGFFQTRSSGDLMMRVASNARIRDLVTSSTLSALIDGTLALMYIALIFYVHSHLALLVGGLGALQVCLFVAARHRYRDLMSRDLEAQARAQNDLVQILGGIETLKVAGAERQAVDRWSNLFVDELNVSLQQGRLRAVVEALMGLLRTSSPLVLLGYGGLLVMRGELSLGTMLGLSALAAGFLAPLASLVNSALSLQHLGSYVERIDDVMSVERESEGGPGRPPPRLTGKISVEGVSFRYAEQSPNVLEGVSLEIEAGTTCALVGASGSGKSTLAGVLLGLHRPTRGTVRYDGHDLFDLDLRAVRRQLGVVPQHPYVFGRTVHENVTMGDDSIPQGRIRAACQAAQILDDIHRLPMGLDTVMAEAGASLSGGQRQRLAVARALVHRPAVLLLDEATSALDAQTEQAVVRGVDAQRATRIVIAHRLSTVAQADKIIVLDGGRIVEMGTHTQLLRARGHYSRLIEAQAELGGEVQHA